MDPMGIHHSRKKIIATLSHRFSKVKKQRGKFHGFNDFQLSWGGLGIHRISSFKKMSRHRLDGGFKYVYVHPYFGEDFHFD